MIKLKETDGKLTELKPDEIFIIEGLNAVLDYFNFNKDSDPEGSEKIMQFLKEDSLKRKDFASEFKDTALYFTMVKRDDCVDGVLTIIGFDHDLIEEYIKNELSE